MLTSLHISNYALIEMLDMQFHQGFSVMTGETGAGKSIVLGALGLLLGQRADAKVLREGADKCVIEAQFDLSRYALKPFFDENDLDYDELHCVMRRELSAGGKSRAFINDTPASLAQMKELGSRLIDIHSQHQNLLLEREDFQLDVVDRMAGDEEALNRYGATFTQYSESLKQLETLRALAAKRRSEEEYLRFQCQELEKAALHAGEQEELEQEAQMLQHAQEIKEAFAVITNRFDGEEMSLLQELKEGARSLDAVSKFYPAAKSWKERMESSYIDLKDICSELEVQQDKIDFNPARLDEVNERLNLIYSLQQKHHVSTLDELLEVARGFAGQLQEIDESDEHIATLEREVKQHFESVKSEAALLHRLRTAAACEVEKELVERLVTLGIPNIRFKVEITPLDTYDVRGGDRVLFYFSANKDVRMQLLSQVASGGEISRVMLAIKAMIAGRVNLPTIIFDEIDTGISGRIARRMGETMLQMGQLNRQVISITHLPQVAALGEVHYKVYKQEDGRGTRTVIRELDQEERVNEIAQMMSGEQLTGAAIDNARELMKQNHTMNGTE